MVKNFILEKKLSVLNERKLEERNVDNPFKDMICEDCQERGHANKKYYKCKFYKEASVDDVGTSSGTKRKQSSNLKQAKRQAKRQKEGTNSTVICKSCQQNGHSTSRSRLCPNHSLAKNEVLTRNLGFPYIAFTRKLPLDSIVKSDYKEISKNKIIASSREIRNIVSRAMLLTNSYCLSKSHDSIPHAILTQQYWYSVCQLVNEKKITNSANTPSDLISYWDTFKNTNSNVVYQQKLIKGVSQCLAEACKELETCYNNHTVENFEQRLLYFFKYKLQSLLMNVHPNDISDISTKYYYQFVCDGETHWPSCATRLQEQQ